MKILLASKIDPQAIENLRQKHTVVMAPGAPEEELIERISGCQVLIFRSGVQISAAVLKAAQDLKLLIRAGSGTDNIDLGYLATRPGLPLVRIPEPGAFAVAEMAIAMIFAMSRQLAAADAGTRAGKWPKHDLSGHLLRGKTLGIVGAGNIGCRVGFLGNALEMTVLGCVNPVHDWDRKNLRDNGIALESFDTVIRQADYLSIHVPLNDDTRYMINAAVLSKMKPGSFLVNLARGGVVEEAALKAALESNHLAGAAVDVHEKEGKGAVSPLAALDNVILTPHIGAMTIDSQREIGRRVINIVAALESKTALPVAPEMILNGGRDETVENAAV